MHKVRFFFCKGFDVGFFCYGTLYGLFYWPLWPLLPWHLLKVIKGFSQTKNNSYVVSMYNYISKRFLWFYWQKSTDILLLKYQNIFRAALGMPLLGCIFYGKNFCKLSCSNIDLNFIRWCPTTYSSLQEIWTFWQFMI